MIAACVAGLGSRPGRQRAGLGSPLIGEMPYSSGVARASAAASAGFAPGILAPTEISPSVPGPARRSRRPANAEALRRQPGVARVVGPSVLAGSVPGATSQNPMIAKDQWAIRFALVYDTDPLKPTAMDRSGR